MQNKDVDMMSEFYEKRSKISKNIINELLNYFQGRVDDFVVDGITGDVNHMSFFIEFTAYEYFPVKLQYDMGRIGFSIDFATTTIELENSQKWWDEADLDVFSQELQQEIELRIPDKYLRTRRWLKLSAEIRKRVGRKVGIKKGNANEMADFFCEEVKKKFGDRVKNFCVLDVYDSPAHREFSVEFEAYNYFAIRMNYERGSFGCCISFGERGISLENSQEWWDEANMKVFLKEMQKKIELRIPDKFLKARRRHKHSAEIRKSVGGKGGIKKGSADEMANYIIDKLRNYFQGRIRGFVVGDITGDANQMSFTIKFIAYEYFPVKLHYDKGRIGISIDFGTNTVRMEGFQERLDEADFDILLQEMKKEIELRIPNKFLKAHGWL